MIGYIKGIVSRIEENTIILDNNGIGYLIRMPLSSTFKLSEGMETTIYTYMAFGQDEVSLCGFLSGNELEMFKMLLRVSGIGPKGAMKILSASDAETIRMAILSGDDKLLSASKGISAKQAQKIILELKGKVKKSSLMDAVMPTSAAASDKSMIDEAVNAVTATGFDRAKCMKAVSRLDIKDDWDVDRLIDEIFASIEF